jgi:hypothetical protein
MKRILFFVIALAPFLLTASIVLAQPKSPIDGVWRITEWIEHGDTITHPQPSLIIFTEGYYSVSMLMAPRNDSMPSERGRKLTDAEKIERFESWKWFVGISGGYEVKESTIVMHPMVAKDPADTKKSEPEFKLEGSNTLWLIPTAKGATNVGLRMKLTRLK